MRILAISGSVRRDSHNTRLLRHVAKQAPFEVEIWDGLKSIPPYDQDDDGEHPPRPVTELREAIAAADGLLFATPEYNASIPGVLKNAIDWASRPYGESAWDGKPAAIMGASIGNIATARAQYHLRQSMVFLNMFPLNRPEVMIGHAADRFDAEGNLTDETTKDYIRKLLQALVEWTRRIQQSPVES